MESSCCSDTTPSSHASQRSDIFNKSKHQASSPTSVLEGLIFSSQKNRNHFQSPLGRQPSTPSLHNDPRQSFCEHRRRANYSHQTLFTSLTTNTKHYSSPQRCASKLKYLAKTAPTPIPTSPNALYTRRCMPKPLVKESPIGNVRIQRKSTRRLICMIKPIIVRQCKSSFLGGIEVVISVHY